MASGTWESGFRKQTGTVGAYRQAISEEPSRRAGGPPAEPTCQRLVAPGSQLSRERTDLQRRPVPCSPRGEEDGGPASEVDR